MTSTRQGRVGLATWTARAVAVACGLVAILSGLVAAMASQDGWVHPSALVKMSVDDPLATLARHADPHFHFVTDVEHYDGVYYYAVAIDPLGHGAAHSLIDDAPYRYGHPLHGWLAGMIAFGHASAVPAALFLLSLIGLGVGAWALSRLCARAGRSPWLGLGIAITPGLLYATTVSTTETVGVALILSALLAWQDERSALATVLLIGCCLDKEQYVALPVGLAIWEAVQWSRRGQPSRVARRVAALVVGPCVLAVWYLHVHATFHQWPWHYQPGNIGVPGAGWNQTMRYARALSAGSFDQSQIGALTPPMLVAVGMLLVVASVVAVRMRSIASAPLLGLVAITVCQGWLTLLYPHELIRTPAAVVVLAGVVLATSSAGTALSTETSRDVVPI